MLESKQLSINTFQKLIDSIKNVIIQNDSINDFMNTKVSYNPQFTNEENKIFKKVLKTIKQRIQSTNNTQPLETTSEVLNYFEDIARYSERLDPKYALIDGKY